MLDADWVILGPGSWFTSVMPHLLVPDLLDALVQTKAKRMLTLNVQMDTGETSGFSASDHLEVLAAHAPALHLDAILARRSSRRRPRWARASSTSRSPTRRAPASTTPCASRRRTATSWNRPPAPRRGVARDHPFGPGATRSAQ